ncbi:hypothetical protein ACFQLX_24345 [Streptomyces polyrhachis]|uniref:DUF7144 domain-containing protein n=1 Tax=Streptomyces polyrhachis TaxID=1282885 RepID=A0ABW2GP05_9ACTN
MSASSTPPAGSAAPRSTSSESTRNAWATGGSVFAAVLLLLYGAIGIIQGIAGIADDDVYRQVGDYVFKFDTTAWGWIHLILGAIAFAAGWGVLKGATWGRAMGVGLAVLVAIANFMWLPYQPLWAIIAIGIAVFVIWSLCAERGGRPLV